MGIVQYYRNRRRSKAVGELMDKLMEHALNSLTDETFLDRVAHPHHQNCRSAVYSHPFYAHPFDRIMANMRAAHQRKVIYSTKRNIIQ